MRSLILLALSLAIAEPVSAQSAAFPPPLSDAEAMEVQAAIAAMKKDPRGPYLRIRWFCNDGTVQPPAGSPCSTRGGGVQYAEFNDKAKRLAELHIHVGTILQALSNDDLFDAGRDHYRLKELVLNDYLVGIDDGWVLRRARFYRGARQIEDEEVRSQAFLESLLSNREWTSRNFFLAGQLVATMPHTAVAEEQSTAKIRNLSTEIADLDSAFLQLRVKIHSFPSREDLPAVEAYLGSRNHAPAVKEKLTQLRDELRRQYDARRNVEALARYRRRVPASFAEELQALQRSYEQGNLGLAFSQIAELGPKLRHEITRSTNGKSNLVLMDLLLTLQEQAFVITQDLEAERVRPTPRGERLGFLSKHFAIAHSVGFLSTRERAALDMEIARIRAAQSLSALEYRTALSYLARSLDWSLATARSVFGPVNQRYLQFEPQAAGFLDAVLRASTLLPLSLELGRLSADADRVLGASHHLLGSEVSHGVRGLNPGVAMRTLEITASDNAHPEFESNKIYVLPETTPEMRPVAGVLTLDAGNLLSHIQLLARNLGIPNASIASSHLPKLRAYQDKEVFYAVSPLGCVLLKDPTRLTEAERRLIDEGREARTTKIKLDTSRLKLDQIDPIPLSSLRASDSGVLVGPKAANLGQLAAYFPGQVSDGLALPFGMFYRHANRPFDADKTVLEELEIAYSRARAMKAAGRSESEIDEYMFAQLARVRKAILELEWLPETRQSIVTAIGKVFGDKLSQGVFVRSDTNVEDLPQFSGAGLNLTVPHQRTLDAVLSSIKRVWTSPFSERAYLWRKQILEDQGRIFPSVLLLQSVHSEKSGVLITSGLQAGGREHITIATAEGVGGAVEGEDAETVLVDRAGSLKLLSQAKAPYRRALVTSGSGGSVMVPATMPNYLLREDDVRQLLKVVDEWEKRFAAADRGAVWDIEFGFVDGKLWLFQIRPFVRFRSSQLLERLGMLDRDILARANRAISIQEAI